jgi:hypothetical protein
MDKIKINEAQLADIKNYLTDLKNLDDLKVFSPFRSYESALFYSDEAFIKDILQTKGADNILLSISLNFQRKRFTTDAIIEIDIKDFYYEVNYKNILDGEVFFSERFRKHPADKLDLLPFWIIVLPNEKKLWSDHSYNTLIISPPFIVE